MQSAQFILTAIIIFIIYRTLLTYKKGNLTKVFTVLWLLFWMVVLFFLYEQHLLSQLADLFGISRGVDLALYLSVIILFYLVFKLFSSLEEINQKLTQIIRQDALKRARKAKQKT